MAVIILFIWNCKPNANQINHQTSIKIFHIKFNKHFQFIDATLEDQNVDLVIKYTFGLYLTRTLVPVWEGLSIRETY